MKTRATPSGVAAALLALAVLAGAPGFVVAWLTEGLTFTRLDPTHAGRTEQRAVAGPSAVVVRAGVARARLSATKVPGRERHVGVAASATDAIERTAPPEAPCLGAAFGIRAGLLNLPPPSLVG